MVVLAGRVVVEVVSCSCLSLLLLSANSGVGYNARGLQKLLRQHSFDAAFRPFAGLDQHTCGSSCSYTDMPLLLSCCAMLCVSPTPTAGISASEVKALRQKTGAGMMDCKKALGECGGDADKAVEVGLT